MFFIEHAFKSALIFLSQSVLIQKNFVVENNIVLSFRIVSTYATHNQIYFDETIDRTTNRIRGERIANLNDKIYQLVINDSSRSNLLHDDNESWDKKIWDDFKFVRRKDKKDIQFIYVSKNDDESYLETIEARIWYVVDMKNEKKDRKKTMLKMKYEMKFIDDECEEIVVRMTNHK